MGDHVEAVDGHEGSARFTAVDRAHDRLVGCLAVNMRAEVMKYRRLIGQGGGEQALELAEQRRQRRSR